jgi:hypothetical protein
MGITLFNQWKNNRTEFDVICLEYKSIFDDIDETTTNLLIFGILGFGFVIAIKVK